MSPLRLWRRNQRNRLRLAALPQPARQLQKLQALLPAIEGQSGQQVAEALGIQVASVYVAKGRVMARIKEHIKQCPLE